MAARFGGPVCDAAEVSLWAGAFPLRQPLTWVFMSGMSGLLAE